MTPHVKHPEFVTRFLKQSSLILTILAIIQIIIMVKEQSDVLTGKQRAAETGYIRMEARQRIRSVQLKIEKRMLSINRTFKEERSRTPDVILIGPRRCGSEVLAFYLKNHPFVRSPNKETHFYDKYRHRGVKYYRSILPDATEDERIMEHAPSYFISGPRNLPAKIKRDCPGVKIIVLLCDPVVRAYSEFVSKKKKMKELKDCTFAKHISTHLQKLQDIFLRHKNKSLHDKAFSTITKSYNLSLYAAGTYSLYMRRWMDEFSPSRMKIIHGEDLLRTPGKVIESVQKFLSLPTISGTDNFVRSTRSQFQCLRKWWVVDRGPNDLSNSNFFDNKVRCNDEGRADAIEPNFGAIDFAATKLKVFYEPYNQQLYAMIGKYWKWKGQRKSQQDFQKSLTTKEADYVFI